MTSRTRVLGLERLNRKAHAMPGVIKAAIRDALGQGAQEVVDLMKSLVPVDQGELRDSIGWTFGRPPKGSIAIGSIPQDARDLLGLRVTIFAGNDKAFYARWVEFGTAKNPAQPFFFVAWRALKRRVKSRITRAINRELKRLANG